jgi:ABC-type transport system involved in multi-copper enzyme maturation permease subunit
VVNRARDEGTLELLMSQPIRRDRYLFAILAVRFGALVLPLLAIFALLGVVGAAWSGAGAAAGIAARASALCAALLFAFTSIGLLISVRVRSPARANAYVILCWLAGVALVDFALIGAMLRWQLQPRAVLLLAALNPVQAARLGLLSAGGVDLETLGPVGFYLVQTLGPYGLLALGVVWPTVLGAAAFALALRAFRRFDLV